MVEITVIRVALAKFEPSDHTARYFRDVMVKTCGSGEIRYLTNDEMNVEYCRHPTMARNGGFYDYSNKIIYFLQSNNTERALMHECAHYFTWHVIREDNELYKALNQIRDFTREYWVENEEAMKVLSYGLQNVDEFVAETMCDPKVRELLSQTKIDKTTALDLLIKLIKMVEAYYVKKAQEKNTEKQSNKPLLKPRNELPALVILALIAFISICEYYRH